MVMNFPFTDGCARGISREIAPVARSSNLERVLKRAPHGARRSGPVVRPNVDAAHVQVETQNCKTSEVQREFERLARRRNAPSACACIAFTSPKPDRRRTAASPSVLEGQIRR